MLTTIGFLPGLNPWVLLILALIAIFFFAFVVVATRYKRCPSDAILVVYGKVGRGPVRQVHPRRRRPGLAADPGLRVPEPDAR